MLEKKNIALLYGGRSSEREISIMSGKNVGASLEASGHNVTYIDTKFKDELKQLITEYFDLAFIALHGRGGEDGSIQGFLDTLGIKYTGSKIHASARAINKADTKAVYTRENIPTAKYFVVIKDKDYMLDNYLPITGDDVVVKAASEGSSIGLYFAKGKCEIIDSINKAFEYDDTVVVEKRIPGREFTVAVIEFPPNEIQKYKNTLSFEGNATALPVIEIIPKNDFYDFSSKYDEGGSKHVCPAQIDSDLAEKLQQVAINAHISLGCCGLSRTDIRVDDQNNIFALETNTIPGMTKTSLVPDAARAVGISFDELCELFVEYALI